MVPGLPANNGAYLDDRERIDLQKVQAEMTTIYDIHEIENERDLANSQVNDFRVAYHQALEEIARLREVLEMVEWDGYDLCIWCHGYRDGGGHKPDCPRQAVLGLGESDDGPIGQHP